MTPFCDDVSLPCQCQVQQQCIMASAPIGSSSAGRAALIARPLEDGRHRRDKMSSLSSPFPSGQGVLQYVIIRPLMTVVTTIATLLGAYNDGSMAYNSLYPYVAFINATSQAWALYCLVLMYQVGLSH